MIASKGWSPEVAIFIQRKTRHFSLSTMTEILGNGHKLVTYSSNSTESKEKHLKNAENASKITSILTSTNRSGLPRKNRT